MKIRGGPSCIAFVMFLTVSLSLIAGSVPVSACTVAPHEASALDLRSSASLLLERAQDAHSAHARLLANAKPGDPWTSVVADDLDALDSRLFEAWSALDRNELDWRADQEFGERSDLGDCAQTKFRNYIIPSSCSEQFADYHQTITELTRLIDNLMQGISLAYHRNNVSLPTSTVRIDVWTEDLDQLGRQLSDAKSAGALLAAALPEELEARNRLYNCIQGMEATSSLLLLIDVSGSMQGSKLASAKKAAIDTIRNALKSKTEVAVLAYEGDCNRPIHGSVGFSRSEGELIDFVNGLTADGGTPLASALEVTNRFMQQNRSSGSTTQMILLLADGDDDCGGLSSVLQKLKRSNLLYRHETVGLEVDDSARRQLKDIAVQSGGRYHSATSANLSKVFSDAVNLTRMLDMLGKFK